MATTTQDEAFREIQLNGKQLVFLFMAVTVIAVVIFLFGVLVGRGVRNERGLPTPGSDGAVAAADAPAAAVPAPPPGSSASNAPVTGSEQLGYAARLNGAAPAAEQLQKAEPPAPADEEPKAADTPAKGAAAKDTVKDTAAKDAAKKPATPPATATPGPAPAAAAKASTPAPAPAKPAAAAATAVASKEPSGSGFAIQVAALTERGEADTIVKRLAAKGYPAYVLAPASGAPKVFRVRVGKYTDRHEADTVAAKLQKEEQFKPWVVR